MRTTSPEMIKRIVAWSLEHPAWGCVRLAKHLTRQGVSVSTCLIHSSLIKHGMASTFDRLLTLQEQLAAEPFELCPE